jgi:alpha-galactosidase
LDAETGTITGCIATQGATEVLVTVTTASGTDSRKLTIIGGRRKLALTPPMGWNSWNVWGLAADDRKVRDAADHLVKSGLAAHGFQYVNIDDGWEGERDGEGNIQPNAKFPDMKALADYVHSKGLKLGIYSSPGPRTCGGFAGSYRHEQQDADTYACWGMDFLKYDWCSYGKLAPNPSVEDRKRPYRIMADALERSSRDIVYSICQYGAGNVSQWGAEVGGNLWRTTEDIGDYWGLVYEFINKQEGLEQYAGLGHWNDPDMLVVGSLGWGPSLHPTELTPFQQISHITMWCILAAPLLIGCDLSSLDEFTVNLLSNDEVLDVDQDPLGVQGRRVKRADDHEVWTRPLFDGTLAVAVLNLLKEENAVQLNLREIGVDESVPVRDLWLCRNMGEFRGKCNLVIPPQSSKLLKIGTPANRA